MFISQTSRPTLQDRVTQCPQLCVNIRYVNVLISSAGSADLVCGESLMPLLADNLRPAWLDTGHRDTADGDGAGFWDLIEFLCGLATGHDSGLLMAGQRLAGTIEERAELSTSSHSGIHTALGLGHNNYRMKKGRRLRDQQQCRQTRHPGRLVITITYLLLPTNAMKWSWYLQYCSHPELSELIWNDELHDIYIYVHSRCFITFMCRYMCWMYWDGPLPRSVDRTNHVWMAANEASV